MEKRIYDKKTGIHYELQGDYYLPCLELPKQPKVEIEIWGKRHLRHGIEWEQKGEHKEHLSVLEFKREKRKEELAELEQTIERVQQ